MTLRDIDLKPTYISLEEEVSKSFYVPVMKNSTRFDRISCYFSFDAIAKYCQGIYYLGRNGGTFRLMISQPVSKDTFDSIKSGYEGYNSIDEQMRERMRDKLSIEDVATLSNLSYLITCGLVEIKFAFCLNGLFHEKTGYACDEDENSLCFTGSNNETKASLENNYEKFEVTASWLCSDFDRRKIAKTAEEFNSMWNGSNRFVFTIDPPESFKSYLETFNRGKLFESIEEFAGDSILVDLKNGRVGITLPDGHDPKLFKYKASLQSLIESSDGQNIVLSPGLKKNVVVGVMGKIRKYADRTDINVVVGEKLKDFLDSNTSMEELASRGLSIKHRETINYDAFRRFCDDVASLTVADLRTEQLWDAYFAYRLGKSANFSVPGSGKTATALGMFAYLYKNKGVRRLIVLGPLNSFDSWISEFRRVFGDNIPLKSITSTEMRRMGETIQYHIRFDRGDRNLILLNYEGFDRNDDLTDAVKNRIGKDTMLVFDEVHRIKAVNGKRSSKVIPVAENSEYTLVMTGTPLPNSYEDVYNFLHILYGNDYDEYFVLSPQSLRKLQGCEAEAFNARLQPFYVRTTKAQLGVPPADSDHREMVIASELEQNLFDELHHIRIDPLSLIIRILQVESDPSMLSCKTLDESEISAFSEDLSLSDVGGTLPGRVTEDIVTSKTRRCIEIVEELTSEGKTVVVWCIFIQSIRNITSLLKANGVRACSVYGATEDKQGMIDGFKSGVFQVLVTNPQTLAESVSLHNVCHDAVYFEYSYNLVHLLQSRDRIHRLGLKPGQHTRYHFLETRFSGSGESVSLDCDIHDRLNEKEETMLKAIENDELEYFGSEKNEAESILEHIGFDRAMFDRRRTLNCDETAQTLGPDD